MRKLWISALVMMCGLASSGLARAQNFAPVVEATKYYQPTTVKLAPIVNAPESYRPTSAQRMAPVVDAAQVQHQAPAASPLSESCDSCDQCGGCEGGRCGCLCQHRNRYGDRSSSFHCGCNGSYKFPVPPLYTYHWPGMYSHQLMTDYHSPWRFPPLKPYVDELPLAEMSAEEEFAPQLQRASVTISSAAPYRPVGEIEPMASKMLRLGQ